MRDYQKDFKVKPYGRLNATVIQRRSTMAALLPDDIPVRGLKYKAMVKRIKAALPDIKKNHLAHDLMWFRYMHKVVTAETMPPRHYSVGPKFYKQLVAWHQAGARLPDRGELVVTTPAPRRGPPPAPDLEDLLQPANFEQTFVALAGQLVVLGRQLDYWRHQFSELQRTVTHFALAPSAPAPAVASSAGPAEPMRLPASRPSKPTFAEIYILPKTTVERVPWQIRYTKEFEKSLDKFPSGMKSVLAGHIKRFAMNKNDQGLLVKFFASLGGFQKDWGLADCIAGYFRVTRKWRVIVNKDDANRIYYLGQVVNRGAMGFTER